MKKLLIVALLLMTQAGLVQAQESQESVSIKSEQVPLIVKQAYEKDYGTLPETGHWSVQVNRTMQGNRTSITPLWYSFKKRDKKEKIEVRISPEGVITETKGIAKSAQPEGSNPGSNN
jgi:hypothetical protein